jgi:hypothetical protein
VLGLKAANNSENRPALASLRGKHVVWMARKFEVVISPPLGKKVFYWWWRSQNESSSTTAFYDWLRIIVV